MLLRGGGWWVVRLRGALKTPSDALREVVGPLDVASAPAATWVVVTHEVPLLASFRLGIVRDDCAREIASVGWPKNFDAFANHIVVRWARWVQRWLAWLRHYRVANRRWNLVLNTTFVRLHA